MDARKCLLDISPWALRAALEREDLAGMEELRLRTGQAPCIVARGRERKLGGEVTPELIRSFLEKATGASMYSFSDTISNGFIPCGGLRIGVCGEAMLREGRICGYRHISSLAVRLPGEHKGCCDGVYKEMMSGRGGILIISPPGGGKTTALRETVRKMSNGGEHIGVADERNEISASGMGRTGFDLGEHTDVIVGAPKAQAAIQLLRGMSPDVIAMDEISSREDMEAVTEICSCGVRLLATCHAGSREELHGRRQFRALERAGAFTKLLCISNVNGARSYSVEELR